MSFAQAPTAQENYVTGGAPVRAFGWLMFVAEKTMVYGRYNVCKWLNSMYYGRYNGH
jgi:hypothetical protein